MKIAILGATGRSGRAVVDEALRRGHHVRALVRDPARMTARSGVEIVAGTPLEPADVLAVVTGCDVVISGLGPQPGTPPDLMTRVAAAVVAAAAQGGPTRYISVSGAGTTLPGDDKDLKNRIISGLFGLFAGAVVKDKRGEYDAMSASTLDFTLVRPPQLVEGKPRGKSREGPRGPIDTTIDRADLAAFLLDVAEDKAGLFRRRAPFVSW